MLTNRKKTVHVFVMLFILVFLACILTYIIPGGEFERALNAKTGQTVVLADSYKLTQANHISPLEIPGKFYEAITSESAAKLIFFILIIGGVFEIVMQTGSLNLLCEKILFCFRNKHNVIIVVFVSLFSIFGFTMGLTTASIIFIPIGILAAKILGFDKMTGTAMVALGANAGFAAGIFNPFSVGVAQTIAEVPLYSGAWIRVLLLIVLIITTSIYIIRYAKKQGRISSEEQTLMKYKVENVKMSLRQIIIVIEFVISFVILTYGVSVLKYEINEIVVIFLIMGLVIGLTAGFGINKVCETFTNGSKKLMKGVFVIGIAATLRLILTEGGILDTITYQLTNVIYDFPNWAQLLGMFYSNAIIDVFITSGSAHAAIVMPIMTPMADFLGLTRQSAVFAFQLGDGLVNLTSPISTTLTGIIAVSEISYAKWIKFFIPLVGIYMIIGTIFIIFAGVISY